MANAGGWRELYRAHARPLLLFARQFTSSRADAEDALQDGLVRFAAAATRPADPLPYLYACVRTAALDRIRSQRRSAEREARVARDRREDVWFDTPGAASEEASLVQAALQRLQHEQREVVLLKVWGGLTFPEIAEVCHIPVNTAASRFRYGLAALREHLTPIREWNHER